MSFGRAVIVPRIGCIPETLDVRGGSLYNPNDSEGLSMALQSILSDDLKAMGQYNRTKVEDFSWQKIAKMTLAAYSNFDLVRNNNLVDGGRHQL
jgi:glycosyltransferase involved in cell wall biosynthesis